MSVEGVSKEVLLRSRESHPKCPSFHGLGFWTEQKGESELSTGIHHFCFLTVGTTAGQHLQVLPFLP